MSVRLRYFSKRSLEGYIFIIPWLIGFLFFRAGPMLFSLVLTFLRWSAISSPRFAGLANWLEFIGDPVAWRSVLNTLYFTAGSVPLSMLLALLLALLINRPLWGRTFFRTCFYLPKVVTGVSLAIIFMWLFQPDFGLVNDLLAKIGIQGPRWYGSLVWAMPTIIIMSLWGVGVQMVIFLAGLQDIPVEMYESAEVDGANAWHKFVYITVPGLTPVILFNLIINIINAFMFFTPIYVITGGGPANSTIVLTLYIYNHGFRYFRFGYAATLTWVLFAIVLTLATFALRSSRSWVFYRGGK